MHQDTNGTSGVLGTNHMRLSANTYWVHLAPGAYVKGAIEYFTKENFDATGHGVLSGENYVYQANVAENYVAVKSDMTNLRMWWHRNLGGGQTWHWRGADDRRATIWKCHSDPIIQMGWTVRNVQEVTIDTLNIIHSRYIKNETFVPSAIIGASPFYSSGQAVDPSQSISMTILNVVCDGLCPALFRIMPLRSYQDFVVRNVAFPGGKQNNSIGTGESLTGDFELDSGWGEGDHG